MNDNIYDSYSERLFERADRLRDERKDRELEEAYEASEKRKLTAAYQKTRRILYGETTTNPDPWKHGEKQEP